MPLDVLSGHYRALDRPVLRGLRGIASGTGVALSEPLDTRAAPTSGKQRAAPFSRLAGCRFHHCLRADGQLLDLPRSSCPAGHKSLLPDSNCGATVGATHSADGSSLDERPGVRCSFKVGVGLPGECVAPTARSLLAGEYVAHTAVPVAQGMD